MAAYVVAAQAVPVRRSDQTAQVQLFAVRPWRGMGRVVLLPDLHLGTIPLWRCPGASFAPTPATLGSEGQQQIVAVVSS